MDTSVLIGSEASLPPEEDGLAVSAVSVGELEAGVLLARSAEVRAGRLRRLTAVTADLPVVEVDRAVAGRYGELRAASGRMPTNDLWIAATALAYDFALLTRDERQAALPLVRARLIA